MVCAGFAPAGFAGLAPVVDQLAGAQDGHALAILERNGQALASMVSTIARHLNLRNPPVCALGGAMVHLARFRQAYLHALSQACPGAQPQPAGGDGCAGALALAAALLAP